MVCQHQIRGMENTQTGKLGSKIAFVAHFLGWTMRYTCEIVDFSPNKQLVMRTSEGPFPMDTGYRWEPTRESATRMYLHNRGKPTGFSALLAPLMKMMMRRANRKDLELFKQILESG